MSKFIFQINHRLLLFSPKTQKWIPQNNIKLPIPKNAITFRLLKHEKDRFYFVSAKINSAKSPQDSKSAKIYFAKYAFFAPHPQ